MLSIKRSGSGASIAQDIRNLVNDRVPLATAKALTFTAQKAQAAIVSAMPKVFAGGATRYTLNSTRIESASVEKLFARVAVKDRAAPGGTVPENYLAPSVFGAGRREKRFEKSLRLSGLLNAGERAMSGDFAKLDAQGNFEVSELRSILRTLRGSMRVEPKKGAKRQRGRVLKDIFVGTPPGPNRFPGVYRRKGTAAGGDRTLEPLLIFVKKQPRYGQLLDFDGIAREVALREFEPTFRRLLK